MLEHDGEGLNLTEEVRDGILNHTGPDVPETLEGGSCAWSTASPTSTTTSTTRSAPGSWTRRCCRPARWGCWATTSSMRIDALVHDLVETSEPAGDIVQSADFAAALMELRSFMFEHVYLGPVARRENARRGARW